MATTGQTINDRLNAVRYALAGQGLARTVCKATTEEVLGPKKKHMDYLLACTEEPNVSIPQLANLLIDRTQHSSWAVVFKALISIHHLLNYGNERFTQYLATSNHSFELKDFMDRTTPQGYNMSTYVRLYSKYVNDKIASYKTLAIDLCKIKPGKDNALRTMNMENLTKTLPVVHAQFDSLLDFNVEAKDLNNGIIMAAFKLLYKDLNRIFAAYQEAIINLVERYFNLSRKKTREALSMYKKYLARMDKVANFFKVVEQVGLDKSEMPDTSKLNSLLTVFESHLAQLEAKKRGATPSSPASVGDSDEKQITSSPSKEIPTPEPKGVQPTSDSEAPEPAKPAQPPPPPPAASSGPSQSPARSAAAAAPTTTMHAKKQPPARPTPIVTPKAVQSETKPAPSIAPSTSGPATSAASTTSEKKAPPERPAKPPSRPPPPSAATTSPSAASGISAPAPAPPHPPPPHSQTPRVQSPAISEQPRASSMTTTTASATDSQPTSSESNQEEVGATVPVSHEGNGSSEIPQVDGTNQVSGNTASGYSAGSGVGDQVYDNSADAPACSGTTGSVTEREEVPPSVGETNHIPINNVESNHVSQNGVQPPPPSPPIDMSIDHNEDVEAPPSPPPPIEADQGELGRQTPTEAREEDSPVNDANNSNDSQAASPPPPPPLVEED